MKGELWSEQVTPRPNTVTAYERADKHGQVYLRAWSHRQKRERATKVGTVRDARGRLVAKLLNEARREAREWADELAGEGEAQASGSQPGPKRLREQGPLTLAKGKALAFSDRGRYPLDPAADKHTADFRVALDQAVTLLGGGEVLWQDVTPGMVRSIWRRVRRQHSDGNGYRRAEKMVAALFSVASWLQEEFPEQRFPRPIRRWRSELKEHWAKTGAPVEEHRPRHSPDEVRALFEHRDEADPRVALALVVGAELRGGQLVRTMRSHCNLDGEVWIIRPPSPSLRKRTPKLALNELERFALHQQLTIGYLVDLERAYRGKQIPDYALFPAGKLRGRRAPVERGTKPMHNTTLIKLFHKLEIHAGVTPVEGRAWHGIRRAFSDLYENATEDARVKDQLGGWKPGSEMRRTIYQEAESAELLLAAAAVRARYRPGFGPESYTQSYTQPESEVEVPSGPDVQPMAAE